MTRLDHAQREKSTPGRATARGRSRLGTLARVGLAAAGALAVLVRGEATFAATGDVYQVGVAKRDVTPRYPIRLNGFGFRRTESEGVTQPIWAKALAFGADDQRPAILITLDSLGVRETQVEEVARRLKQRFGVERERLAVTFSHSHTTPKVVGACDTIFSTPISPAEQARIEQYTGELIDAMEAVAAEALSARQPSTLSWGVGQVGFAKNRRPQGGPVDHSLPVLVVKSADGGVVRAVFTTYACHCVTLSHNKISGDWAGFAQRAIESRRPGVIALTSIGCGSDANPDSGVTGDNTAIAAAQGDQIAVEVERVLAGELRAISGPLGSRLSHLELPLQSAPTRDELTKLAAQDDPAGYNAKFQLARLDRGESLPTAIRYPIQSWEFGDSLAVVFLGGEICCDYAVRLRERLDPERLWLNGYSNDFCAYIPSERLLREGGYGGGAEVVYFALPNTLAPGLEESIVSQTCRQVSSEFHRSDAQATKAVPSWSVPRSLASIRVKPGLVVEAVATEPLVADPVAIDFAPDGALWVAEMPDYSRFADEQFVQHGNVRRLTDVDGDGRYDVMSVYVDGLRFPTGVKAWRRGVLVCDAPDVIYCEDTDGDGRADVRRVLLTGFQTGNAQARVNSLRWGLDNWLYGSCGLLGGSIRTATGRELDLGQRDFRFRPDDGRLEPVTGRTQQGRARNDWGDWFGCENESLLDHYPLVDRYLARNPRMTPPPPEQPTPEPAAFALHPAGEPTLFKLSGPPGRPTSVCGLEFYRDELLGEGYANNAFVAEPVNQLVRRLVVSPRGGTFVSRLASDEQSQEFLASTDPWFRPVQVRTGPDGCLYVVDMHRAVIEHQKFIPAESLREADLWGGRDEGRIFRIRPAAASPRPRGDLTQRDSSELVAALDSPNGEQRDQVQELLVQRRDPACVAPLRRLAASSPRAAARLHALCTLDGLEALDPETLSRALDDDHPAVRRHAVRLSETLLAQAPQLGEKLLRLVGDGDPQVRIQTAYSLGEWRDPRVPTALAEMAARSDSDPYLLAAVWSSVHHANAQAVCRALLARVGEQAVSAAVIAPALGFGVDFGEPADLASLGSLLDDYASGAPEAWVLDMAAKLLGKARQDPAVAATVEPKLVRLIGVARTTLDQGGADDMLTLAALRLVVAAESRAPTAALIKPFLTAQRTSAVQCAAIELLLQTAGDQGIDVLLESWTSLSGAAREQAFAAVCGRNPSARRLLDAVAAGALPPVALDATQRQRLLRHADAAIRARAEAALATPDDAARQEIVERFLAEDNGPGAPERGQQLFAKHCATCHLLDGVGHRVGPDLAALTSRSKEAIFESILDPNRAVDERYRSYTALTVEGLALSGVLVAETSAAVTIADQQGQTHVVRRTELERLSMSSLSLMPEGLERELSPADVNDLAAYLGSLGSSSGLVPEGAGSAAAAETRVVAPGGDPSAAHAPAYATAAAREIAALAADLAAGDRREYERIPKMWETALAAGRRNDSRELAEIMNLAIPPGGAPPTDWQIVVLGGGVVNGLSEAGARPRTRLAELLSRCHRTADDWRRLVESCVHKADDPQTPLDTRYDALRVLAAADWQFAHRLLKYAVADAEADLQTGAVQSLVDAEAPEADAALIDAAVRVNGYNRRRAIGGLLQTDQRARLLAEAIASGRIAKETLTAEELDKLNNYLKPDKPVLN